MSRTVCEMTKLTPLAWTIFLLLLTLAGLAVRSNLSVPRKVRVMGAAK